MQIFYKDIPLLKENDKSFFQLLEGVINSVDELASLEIRKNISSYSFRVATSLPSYLSPLIGELNNLHNMIGIKVDFSKSIKSSSSISYKINLD